MCGCSKRILRTRLDLSYSITSHVTVEDLSAYRTSAGIQLERQGRHHREQSGHLAGRTETATVAPVIAFSYFL
jgi:hypothetical protein